MFSFKPSKLQKAREKIEKVHKAKVMSRKFEPDETLEALIVQLATTKKENLHMKALMLSNEEVCMVAGYLPHNYYPVDMTNLFRVVEWRLDSNACEVLYTQWQQSYESSACNQFICELLGKESLFYEFLSEKSVDIKIYKEILLSEDVLTAYSKLLQKMEFSEECTFGDCIKKIGVSGKTRLCFDLEFLYYTYCNEHVYSTVTEEYLLNVVKKYGQESLKLFVTNFLEKLELTKLQEFDKIAVFLNSVIGPIKSEKCKQFFQTLPHHLFVKYRDWMNTTILDYVFGDDERSRFWKQFRFVFVEWVEASDSVIMEFEEKIVTEFICKDLGKEDDAMGPIYFFEKEDFNKMYRFHYEHKKNKELRDKLFSQWTLQKRKPALKKLIEDRRIHNPKEGRNKWQNVVEGILIRKNITEKI